MKWMHLCIVELHLRRVVPANVASFQISGESQFAQLLGPARVTAGIPCAKIQLRELHFMVKK